MTPSSVACLKVHTFYEAVGFMISAQTDSMAQEHLVEKYMMLPNQVWDGIINRATHVSTELRLLSIATCN